MSNKLIIVASLIFAVLFISVLSITLNGLLAKGKDSALEISSTMDSQDSNNIMYYNRRNMSGAEVLETIKQDKFKKDKIEYTVVIKRNDVGFSDKEYVHLYSYNVNRGLGNSDRELEYSEGWGNCLLKVNQVLWDGEDRNSTKKYHNYQEGAETIDLVGDKASAETIIRSKQFISTLYTNTSRDTFVSIVFVER